MHAVTRQPKPQAGGLGQMAQHGQRQSHFTPKHRNRQVARILGPMVAMACKLKLWALALDLVELGDRWTRPWAAQGVSDG